MNKNSRFPIVILFCTVIIIAFLVGLKFDEISGFFSTVFSNESFLNSNRDKENTSVSDTADTLADSEPVEPEPEKPVYSFVEITGEFYIIHDCSAFTEPEGEAISEAVYTYGTLVPVTALETTTGWYRLEDGSCLSPENVNEGRVIPMDTTMYVAKECNIRSGPSTDFDKVGKYSTEGEEVHVTGQDILTEWYQIDGEKYVGSSNLIASRTVPWDEKMIVVKKCNVRKGPSTDYEKVAEYNSGKEVHVIGQDVFTGWYLLEGDLYVGSSNLADKVPTVYNSQDDLKTIKYEWKTWYKHKAVKWSIKVDKGVYEYYKGKKRVYDYSSYSDYFTDASNDYYVQMIAKAIKEMGEDQKLTTDQIAQEAIYFLSTIPYVTDKKSRKADEWPKYIIETLYDNGGDCEDTSLMTAAVLMQYGYKVALIKLPGHIAVGIAGGKFSGTYYTYKDAKYYYVETTGEGWKIGEIPDEFKTESATIYALN